jgi:hypothetical protein
VPGTSNRLSRAAAFAFTASLATSAVTATVSCGGDTNGGNQTVAPAYGAPAYGGGPVRPVDGGGDADAAHDADADAGGQALYGAPAYGAQPVDSGNG